MGVGRVPFRPSVSLAVVCPSSASLAALFGSGLVERLAYFDRLSGGRDEVRPMSLLPDNDGLVLVRTVESSVKIQLA